MEYLVLYQSLKRLLNVVPHALVATADIDHSALSDPITQSLSISLQQVLDITRVLCISGVRKICVEQLTRSLPR